MTKLLAAALLMVSTTVSAQTVVATGSAYAPDVGYAQPPGPRAPRAIDARLGMMLGGADVGDADGFSMGASGALGYRIGDLTLRGLVDYYKVGDGADEAQARRGRATRFGGALRYSFANNGRGEDAGPAVDFWGELGAGYEHVAWRHGGLLDRPSGEIAVGIDVGHRGHRTSRGDQKEVGYFMAVRSLIAQGPEMDGVMATCSGPCSEASKPPRTDVSMFFELGVHWGR